MRTFLGAVAIGFVCLAGVAAALGESAQGQASQPAPVMTDEVFKSVQVLKGIPVDTFFEAMGMFASSMGNDCTFCHVKEAYFDRAKFAVSTPNPGFVRITVSDMEQTVSYYRKALGLTIKPGEFTRDEAVMAMMGLPMTLLTSIIRNQPKPTQTSASQNP